MLIFIYKYPLKKHSSITMTMDLYTHLLPEVNDKCVNLLNNIVSSAVEPKRVIEKFGT